MKELFQFLAKYNKLTNQTMMDILQTVPADDLVKDTGAFYKSIMGTLNHLLGSDVAWINRILGGVPDLEDLAAQLPEMTYSREPGEMQWATLDEFRPVRETVDGIIVDMIDRMPDEQFGQEITFKNWRGEEQTKLTWYLLMHFMNHETHHRGVVSTLLDQMGVENDYSNINRIEI
ncbi:MAG TPA: DinB family protein [Candidatus Lokiarchaeia archaeon]|nr:DinB family protein [Candidatus Lokiarchaeia archaeon]